MARLGTGARLAYVIRKIPGKIKREIIEYVPMKGMKRKDPKTGLRSETGLVRKVVEVDAGYMVYFPRGHAIRFRDLDHLAQYGFVYRSGKQAGKLRKPRIINLQGLNDPNSPLGQMLLDQDEEVRSLGYLNMEEAVIQLATSRSGTMLMPEQTEDRSLLRRKPEQEQVGA